MMSKKGGEIVADGKRRESEPEGSRLVRGVSICATG